MIDKLIAMIVVVFDLLNSLFDRFADFVVDWLYANKCAVCGAWVRRSRTRQESLMVGGNASLCPQCWEAIYHPFRSAE